MKLCFVIEWMMNKMVSTHQISPFSNITITGYFQFCHWKYIMTTENFPYNSWHIGLNLQLFSTYMPDNFWAITGRGFSKFWTTIYHHAFIRRYTPKLIISSSCFLWQYPLEIIPQQLYVVKILQKNLLIWQRHRMCTWTSVTFIFLLTLGELPLIMPHTW